jgi:hypothetical protein
LSSRTVNGIGAFVPAICKVEIHHNIPRPGAGGDSMGMVEFINENLPEIEKKRPYVEFVVCKRSGPPKLTAYYNNGSVESKFTPRWKKNQIAELVNAFCDASRANASERKFSKKVLKGTGHIEEHWDPFHADKMFSP